MEFVSVFDIPVDPEVGELYVDQSYSALRCEKDFPVLVDGGSNQSLLAHSLFQLFL